SAWGLLWLLPFDDVGQHREPFTIGSTLFAQGRSHEFPAAQALFEALWQRNDGVPCAPAPGARLIGIAEPEPCDSFIQVHRHAICLTFFTSVVASIGEHPDFEERDRLEFFVSDGEAIMLEKEVAGLLDDVLQRDKAGLILFQTLLQSGNSFLDGRTVLARRSLFRFGANEAIGEDRCDQF